VLPAKKIAIDKYCNSQANALTVLSFNMEKPSCRGGILAARLQQNTARP